MRTYHIILQVLSILFLIVFIFTFIRLLISISRSKRIENFAITGSNDTLSFEQRLYKLVYKISDFISSLVIFNAVSTSYEKYVSMADNKFRRGMDFISLKTIFGFVGMFLYLLWDSMYHVDITSLTLVISFIIGSIIPDIYYKLKYYRYNAYIVDDLLRAAIDKANEIGVNTNNVVLPLDKRTIMTNNK